jgi:uncharacterized protein YqjF (DUF2071 family)
LAGRRPEERVPTPVTRQWWGSLTFLHWPLAPHIIQARLPEGFEVDTFDGSAWVSMTPFVMTLRLGRLPPLPGMSTFPETNLRTYVRGPDGRDGLWFLSLEADSLPLVVGASTLYGVPYKWADMEVVRNGDTVRYRSRRRLGRPATHDITVRVGPPCGPTDLDNWLSGRWRAWTRVAGRTCSVPVEHAPWPLLDATVVQLHETLFEAAGLAPPGAPALVRHAHGVDVHLGRPRPVG